MNLVPPRMAYAANVAWWAAFNRRVNDEGLSMPSDLNSPRYRLMLAAQASRFSGFASASREHYEVVDERWIEVAELLERDLWIAAERDEELAVEWVPQLEAMADSVHGVLNLHTFAADVIHQRIMDERTVCWAWQELWFSLEMAACEWLGVVRADPEGMFLEMCLGDVRAATAQLLTRKEAFRSGEDLWARILADPRCLRDCQGGMGCGWSGGHSVGLEPLED